jgi:PleD family two-component response regulator
VICDLIRDFAIDHRDRTVIKRSDHKSHHESTSIANHESLSQIDASYPVLVVEDTDSLRALLRESLEAQGHTVIEARDEPDALRQLDPVGPLSVITELKLPAGDGFGVLRAAKELDPICRSSSSPRPAASRTP